MAEYKGLTIRFEGDDSDLSAVLHRIGENARDAQRHLTGINEALRLDPSNSRLAGYQLKYVGEEAKAARDRLEALKAGLAEIPNKIQQNEQEIDRLGSKVRSNVETFSSMHDANEQLKQSLVNLESELGSVRYELETLDSTGEGVSEEFKELYDSLKRAEVGARESGAYYAQLESSAESLRAELAELERTGEKNTEEYRQLGQRANEAKRSFDLLSPSLEEHKNRLTELERQTEKAAAEMVRLTGKDEQAVASLGQQVRSNVSTFNSLREATARLEAALTDYRAEAGQTELEMEQLEREGKETSDSYNALRTTLKSTEREMEEVRARHEHFKSSAESLRTELRELERAGEGNSEEYRRLSQRASELEHEIDQLEPSLESATKRERELERQTEETAAEMVNLTNKNRELRDSVGEYNEQITIATTQEAALTETEKTLRAHGEALKTKMYSVGGSLADIGVWAQSAGDKLYGMGIALSTIAGISVATLGRQIVDETTEFGNAMSQVGVYLGVTDDGLEHMSDLALKWGKDTQYSATEAAQAMSELAKGGLSAMEIEGGAMAATMDLAAAGQMNLADAALTVAQSMRAFGLQASDTTEVADALAGVANGTTSTVEGLANGFRYVAGWSRLSSWDIHEVSGALGLLADYGLQGEMAGTALRNVLMRLAAPTDKARGIMEEYGIEVRDAEGNMKSAVEVVDQLNAAFEGVDKEERDAALNTMFGARGINAASALMDAGSEALQEYIDLSSEAGAASEMAQGQMGDLGWALEYLKGEAETAAVNLGNALTPVLIDAAEAAEDLLAKFNDLSSEEQLDLAKKLGIALLSGPTLVGVGTALKGIGSGLSGIGGGIRFLSEFSKQVRQGGAWKNILGRTSAALGGFIQNEEKLAIATEAAAASLTTLKVAAGFALAAVVLVGGYAIWRHFEDARIRTEKLEGSMEALATAAGDSGRAAEELSEDLDGVRKSANETRDEMDELADSHLEFAAQIRDENRQLSHNEDMLNDARDTVVEYLDEMTSGAELDAEAQGRLTTALQVLESQYGITIKKGEDGIYYLETEEGQADLTKDAIYRLCDAKLYEAQVDAYTSRYSDLYARKLDYEEQRADLLEDIADTEREINRIQGMSSGEKVLEYGSVREANDRLRELEGDLGAYNDELGQIDGYIEDTNKALDDTEYELGAVETAAEGAETSLGQWASMDDRIRQFASGSMKEFGAALDNAGVDAETMKEILQGLSDDELARLMEQFNGSADSLRNMLAVMTGDTELFSDAWDSTISSLADSLGVSEEKIIETIIQGIEDGTIRAGTTANGLGRIITDALNNPENLHAAAQAGEAVTEEAASAAGAGYNASMKRIQWGRMTRSAMVNPVSREMQSVGKLSGGWGKQLSSNFASGMTGVSISSRAANMMYATQTAMRIYEKTSYTWGYDMMQNFANGMGAGKSAVLAKAIETANGIKDFMGFSVPKLGPLHDEDVWGVHMMQNFADGMYRALPQVERASLAMAEAVQQPTIDLGYEEGRFLTGVAENVRANQNVNIFFDGINVNDNPAIRNAFIDLMYEANRLGAMNGGKR